MLLDMFFITLPFFELFIHLTSIYNQVPYNNVHESFIYLFATFLEYEDIKFT